MAALLGMALLSFTQVRASHLLGAEMAINQFEKGKFEIRVYVYTDCSSLSSLRFTPITVKSKCGNYNHSAGTGPYGGIDVTPTCKKECTKCSNSSCTSGFGIRKSYFVDTIYLGSITCNEFIVGWEQNLRTSKITTGANDQDIYIEGSFNKVNFKEKTSLYFSSDPLLIVAKGMCVTSIQSADTKGFDSVSYALQEPLSGQGAAIPYTSGYSYDMPVKFDGYPNPAGTFDPPVCKGFHFNESTGEINFKAVEADVTPIVIEATGWTKDTTGKYNKAATIRRDVVLSVIEAPENRAPVLTGFDCSKSNTLNLCAGIKNTATLCTFDPDIDDTVTVEWNNGIAGASFDVEKGKKWPKAFFSWAPDTTMVRKEPYTFIVSVSDGTCPIPAKVSKLYYAYVTKKKTSFTYKKTGTCNKYEFDADPGNGDTTGAKYQWFVNGKLVGTKQHLTYTFEPAGQYPIKLMVSQGCDQVFYDTISITRPQLLSASRRETVEGDTVTLTGYNGQLFTWWVGKDTLATHSSKAVQKVFAGNNYYHVQINDTINKCEWHDSILVTGYVLVWPGDADRNGLADYRDLLSMGTGCGTYGPKRNDTSTTWSPKKATVWPQKNIYANYSHLDCNGNGWVEASDMGAILRNYDKNRDSVRYSVSSGPPIQFVFYDSVMVAGGTGTVDIQVGSDMSPLNWANGIAFSFEYPEKYMKSGISYAWRRNFTDWSTNINQLSIYKQIGKGYAEGSVSAPGKYPRSFKTPTTIATISFQLKDTSEYSYNPKGEWVKLSFFNFYAVDSFGRKINLTAVDDSVFVRKPLPDEIVYPGDADRNHQADYRDLLSLGIGMGSIGPVRDVQGISWKAYKAKAWDKRTLYADYAHLDCDGSGAIDLRDTLAITNNYDPIRENIRGSTASGAPLQFKFDKDTLYAGDAASLKIYAGSSATPLKDANGLCFSYEFSENLVKSGSYAFAWNTSLFPLSMHVLVSSGYGEASASRIGQDPVTLSTPTEIGRIRFTLKDSLQHIYPMVGEWVKFSFYNLYAVDSFGRVIPLKDINDSVLVLKPLNITSSVEPDNFSTKIRIYPNPADRDVYIESDGLPIREIRLINMVGENVQNIIPASRTVYMDISALPKGIYILEISTVQGSTRHKLLIQ
jgi:hypothetical protein